MKVSLVHSERRCAQVLALDVVTPEEFALMLEVPPRLTPTQRCDFTLARGALLCIVASACFKQQGPAPLLIELEAEEGETLHADTVRVFVLDPSPAHYTEAALDEGKLVRVDAPLVLAGDRQQFGLASIEISPTRDALLVAIVNRELVVRGPRPAGCLCREYIGDALKVETYCPVHGAPAVLEESGQVSP